MVKKKLLPRVVEYEDPYEDKLLELIEKVYRSGDLELFKELAKFYEEGINKLDFKQAYMKAKKLVETRMGRS